jgi:hypothetical protein
VQENVAWFGQIQKTNVTVGADTTPPTVTGVTPASGATGIATSVTVVATFSEAIDPSTLTTATVTLAKQGSTTPITAAVSYNSTNQTATLTPSTSLDPSAGYTATVKGGTSGVKDLAGNALAVDKVWSFTTASAPDTTPPTVIGVTPADTTTGVPTSTAVTAAFSEAIDASTLTTANFTLATQAGATPVAATVSYNTASNTATLLPGAPLQASTAYSATVKGGASGVKDLAGNALAADKTWSFTTAATADTTPPTVASVSPASGATTVATSAAMTATFSEAIDNTTLTTATVTLVPQGSTRPVAAALAYNGATFTATLTPSAALQYSTVYTATVKGGSSGVKDLAGNPLAADKVWSFTTAAAPDTTPPTVTGFTPASGATGVATTSTATATFSEAIDPSTVTTATISLVKQGTTTAITATVAYNSTNQTATLTPSSTLLAGTTYTATVKSGSSGVKDLAGNPLAADKVWSFTTAGTAGATLAASYSSTPPTTWTTYQTQTYPVTVTNTGTATWNATGTNYFRLGVEFGTASDWPGDGWATDQRFRLPNDVAPGASVTITVGVTAPSTAGSYVLRHRMVQENVAWFGQIQKTNVTVAADTTPPTVTAVTPATGTNGISTSSTVTATFSEGMSAASLTTGTVTLIPQGSTTPLAGTVTYNGTNQTVTLVPSAALQATTTYTATVKGGTSGAKDLSGNPLAVDKVWSFTTAGVASSAANTPSTTSSTARTSAEPAGASPTPPSARADTAPTILAVTPQKEATGVAATTKITITFVGPLDPATLTGETVMLVPDGSTVPVATTISYDKATQSITLTPKDSLRTGITGTAYTLTIKGGAKGVKSAAGKEIASDTTSTFTTAIHG